MNEDPALPPPPMKGPIPLVALPGRPDGLEPLAVPIGRFASILRRHLWIVFLTCLLGTGTAVLAVRAMPKLYSAEVAILIEPQRTQVSDLQAISPDSGDVGGLVRTQIDILRSQTLNIEVVKSLHLTGWEEFLPKGGLITSVKAQLRQLGLLAVVEEQPLSPESATEIAAAVLASKITFANEARSSVLRVTVTTRNPELSALIANEIARQFLDFKRQAKFAAMQRAHDWFQEQMGGLAEQLRKDEAVIDRYRRDHGLDEVASEQDGASRTATVNHQQMDALSHQLVDVSRERARKEGQLSQAQAAQRGEIQGSALPEVLASPVIGQLMAQTAVAVGREAQLAASQGPGNPELVAARAQVRRLQMRTDQEIASVIASLASEVKAARSQEQALQKQMSQLRVDVGGENSAQVGLQSLQTQARATRSIYESFLTRATQLANVSGIQEPDASLVSSARVPLGPSSPQVMRNVMAAGFLSLVLGIALACVAERMRGGFSHPEQVELALGLPLVAILPTVPSAMFRGRRGGRKALALKAGLDKLRGQMRTLGAKQPKIVMVTSALPIEGKSVFAAELARNAAAAGWRVLLIECDLRCPSLARHFKMPTGPGLCEILRGNMIGQTSSVIFEPQDRLHLIVSGFLEEDPQEQLASNRMNALLIEARCSYDLVVLDTPPVLPVADALVLANQADATLMVVRWEKTDRFAVLDAIRLLRGSGANFMGSVLARVDLRTALKAGGRLKRAFDVYQGYQVIRPNRG